VSLARARDYIEPEEKTWWGKQARVLFFVYYYYFILSSEVINYSKNLESQNTLSLTKTIEKIIKIYDIK